MTKLADQPWRIVLVLFGIGLIFLAFRFLWDPIRVQILRSRFRRAAVWTTGEVVGHHVEYHDSDGTPMPVYYSIVEFRTQDGTVTRGQSIQGSGPATERTGATVTMGYDPADPAKVDINSASGAATAGFAYGCSMVMAVPTFLFGLLLLFAALFG